MWWNGQNLKKPVSDSSGHIWHFRVWHDRVDGVDIQRIFFWNADKTETGILALRSDLTLNITRLKQRIAKIARDKTYRQQFRCTLAFPVERHYK